MEGCLSYWFYRIASSPSGLDRDAWDSAKKGLDYREDAPEFNPQSIPIDGTNAQEWVIVLRYFAIALLAVGLIYLVVRLVLNRGGKKGKDENKTEEVPVEEEGPTALSPLEFLHAALAEAKNRGDYKEAIRLLYQIAVKHLHESGKLNAAPDKTAREYASELNWKEKSEEFLRMTLFHEYSWYGSVELTPAEFQELEPRFNAFIDSVGHGR